jgi:hypothetical protein
MNRFLNVFNLLVALTLYPALCFSYFDKGDAEKKNSVMNDISISDYPEFTKNWHLVTVRFREDTKEMRFTYANDLAWKALQGFNSEFPEGAVFGKVAMKTDVDPAFPSSKVPTATKRFQFMVKNKKKYKDSDGWGYALFDSEGYTFKEDLKVTTQSCVACHRIVPERGYVFSRPADLGLSWLKSVSGTLVSANPQLPNSVQFLEVKTSSLPKKLREVIDRKYENAESLEGELKKNAFSGTLDEIIPLLEQQTKKTERPSFLLVNENNFSVSTPLTSADCDPPKRNVQNIIFYNGKKVLESNHCD